MPHFIVVLLILVAVPVAFMSWLDRGVALRPRTASTPRRHRSP